jgi:peptidoglycan hydrolase-like protein with peptidoglycan-binding domain
MEKEDMPNAREEIKKLQEALKGEDEDTGVTDGIMPKKTKAGRSRFEKANGIKPRRKPNEQPAERIVVQNPAPANTKEIRRERS